MDYLGSNSCTLFINYLDIKNIYKTQNYIKIAIFFYFFLFLFFILTCSQTVPYRYLIVIFWSKLHRAAVCIALCAAVLKSGIDILSLEWNNVPIWNGTFCTEREEQPTGFSWRCARLFWLVKFAQLLSKCPNHTKLSPVSRAL